MGHEDYVMLTAIMSSIVLHFTNVFPELPSWVPAIAAGLYKYSVDISRDKKNGRKNNVEVGGSGDGNESLVVKTGEVEIEADTLVVSVDKVRIVGQK